MPWLDPLLGVAMYIIYFVRRIGCSCQIISFQQFYSIQSHRLAHLIPETYTLLQLLAVQIERRRMMTLILVIIGMEQSTVHP